MSNIEKAIDTLKSCHIWDCEDEWALDIAIESIEKQLPKRMLYIPEDNDYKCPTCKSRYDNPQNDGILYCAICGQKIDWSEEIEL